MVKPPLFSYDLYGGKINKKNEKRKKKIYLNIKLILTKG